MVDVPDGIGDGGGSRVDLRVSASDGGCFARVEPITWEIGSAGWILTLINGRCGARVLDDGLTGVIRIAPIRASYSSSSSGQPPW